MHQGKGSPAGHGVETPVDEDSQLCVVVPLGKAMRVKRVDCSLVMRERLARAKAAGNRPSTAHAAYRVVLRIMGAVINSPLHLLGNLSVAINVLGAVSLTPKSSSCVVNCAYSKECALLRSDCEDSRQKTMDGRL